MTSVEGRNANRRVAILVLEEVAPGATVTAGSSVNPTAGARRGRTGRCEQRLVIGYYRRVPPAALEKTVLVKEPAKAEAKEPPPSE